MRLRDQIKNALKKHKITYIPLRVMRSHIGYIKDLHNLKINGIPDLNYLEVHAAEHCNLNCKGCSHFSNLVQNESFLNIEQYTKDIIRLKELFNNIKRIKILGGEPLLNSNLSEIIKITKQHFKNTELIIGTNGILLRQMSPELIDTIKNNNVLIRITVYKPMFDQLNNIKEYLDSVGVMYSTSEYIYEFYKRTNLEGISDVKKVFKQCGRRNCTFLSNGTISVCSIPAVLKYFNEYFNKQLPDSGSINIHDNNLDGLMLKKLLKKPIEFCRYCTIPEEMIWEQSKEVKTLEDWCIAKSKYTVH